MGSLAQRLRDNMPGSRRLWLFAERSSAELPLQEHEGLLAAIREGGAALAGKRMAGHLGKVDRMLQSL